MPLHIPSFSVGDAVSLLTAFLFLYQPGVDRQAVMQWLTDNVFGSAENFSAWGVFTSHKIVEWGGIGFYYLLYTLQIPAIEKFKTHPEPWPWNSPDPKRREEFRELQKRAFTYVIKYHIVVFLFTFALSVYAPQQDLDFVMPHTVPVWWVSAYQIICSTIFAEVGFYFAHRLLHHPSYVFFFLLLLVFFLPSPPPPSLSTSPYTPPPLSLSLTHNHIHSWYRFHKRHHEFKSNVVIASFYVDFMDSLLTDLIPAGFGAVYFKMHWYTVTMYVIPLILNALWVHCGYRFPAKINPFLVVPLATDSEEPHDLHHRENIYNFGGALFVMDRLLGTYKDPVASVARWKKAHKNKVAGKAA